MSGGRFAPSPTGPLHAGSLLTATAAWFHARKTGQPFVLRIDDIDPLRDDAAAKSSFPHVLSAHGLTWDGDIIYQSQRYALYREALAQLPHFACACSRKQISLRGGVHGPDCHGMTDPSAQRLQPSDSSPYCDLIAGQQAATHLDAPVLWRRDDHPSYHLACAVDEIDLKIACVIRGDDLLDSTPIHRTLIEALGSEAPAYGHLPVMRADNGQKLSKQNHAPAIDPSQWHANLCLVLSRLIPGHSPEGTSADAVLARALPYFDLERL